jgi:hypothetical protein
MKNKRYIRLSKKMKAYCTRQSGQCSNSNYFCKYYNYCFNDGILLPSKIR